MLERLDYVKLAPRRILDAGSGPPRRALGKRYPKADVIALDFSLAMLRAGQTRLLSEESAAGLRRPGAAAARGRQRSTSSGRNMALHWLADPLPAFREFAPRARARRPAHVQHARPRHAEGAARGGRRVARARVHRHARPRRHAGRRPGFAAPVMDMEMHRDRLRRRRSLLADLRASGQTSARADRPRGLAGRRFARAAARARLRRAPRSKWSTVTPGSAAEERAEMRKPCVFSSACLEARVPVVILSPFR